VTNEGTITGTTANGVVLSAGGQITNRGAASYIAGGNFGVWSGTCGR
jgi:hypothetical protein